MKSKDIRKENNKKRQPKTKGSTRSLNASVGNIEYCIMYDNYSATVTRADTDGAVAVYKAAERSWKIIPGLLSHSIQIMVENLYLI